MTGQNRSVVGDKAPFRGTLALAQVDASAGPIALAAGTRGITQLAAVMPKLTLQKLDVTAANAKTPAIHLGDASLTGLALDFGTRKLQLGDLIVDGATVTAERLHDGQINLLSLLPPRPAAQSHPASAHAMPAESAPTDAQFWQVSLGRFALNGARLDFRDRALAQPARLSIAPLTVTATGAGSDLSQPVSIHFDAGINGKGHAVGDTTVTPASLVGDLNFTLTGLALKPFVPYMPPLKTLELRSGVADAAGKLHFEGTKIPALRFTGNAAINDFNMLETTTNSPLFAWRAFAFQGINIRNNRVDIRQANLVRPLGQVVVMPDRSFNFTPLMPPKAGAEKTGAKPAGATMPGTASGSAAPPRAATTIAAPAHAAPAKSAITIRLNTLNIRGGSMGFADQSIQPNFSARIDELKGTIENITNAPDQIAAIDLSGQVIDQFSPATIKGSMDLMAYDRKTDMQVVFRNIELPVFNPYSGRYAGYAIGKGKLTTELSYKIDNRALKADHHVVIDQLEWGQATPSKEAVPLPVRLATALLKDNKGVIDLDLPVEGSLDDPKFRIWPVIWQVVGNVIVKAVTAPFQLIGSLFAGADKAQYIDFAPGSADLPQGSAESLAALAKALNQRPALKLDIPAGPGIREDAIAVADAAIDKVLLADEDGKVTSVAALDMDDQHDRLEDLYRSKL
ncbi:MAG TPA: DUF748 domain-containing protein, partial [Devosia sp.]|nr:DUF748 domain-containing protein [Devosia sp.]